MTGVVAAAWIPAEIKPGIHIGSVGYYILAHPVWLETGKTYGTF